jgi:P27 family predicted phage terminase small subunit
MPGRKPTALKRLHGTQKVTRERLRQYEPQPETEIDPVPPHWMTASQKDGWAYVMRHAPRGLLKGLDRGALVLWVEAEDRHRVAAMMQAQLDRGSKLPLLTRNKKGEAVPSPYLRIMTYAAIVMMRCCTELGFSPASRPRVQLIPGGGPVVIEGGADPWDEFTDVA